MKPSPDLELLRAAEGMLPRAHAPYSRYAVGAALRDERGSIFTGCNVENASYGLTLCAERTALVVAVAGGAKRFVGAAVVAQTPPAAYPCGACRQVLSEFCPGAMPVLVACAGRLEEMVTITLERLLPFAFSMRPQRPT